MIAKINQEGLLEYDATFEKHIGGRHDGLNKWEVFAWQKPIFPLHTSGIYKDNIEQYWLDKPVRFAPLNNCVGCFHKDPLLINLQFRKHPEKMQWFKNCESGDNGTWKNGMTYTQIQKAKFQLAFDYDDFSECDNGFCELE